MVTAPKMDTRLEEIEPVRVILDDDFLMIVEKVPRVRHGVSAVVAPAGRGPCDPAAHGDQ